MKPEIHQGDTSPASASQHNSHHTRQPQGSIPIFLYLYIFIYFYISLYPVAIRIYIYIHISCLHIQHPPQAFTVPTQAPAGPTKSWTPGVSLCRPSSGERMRRRDGGASLRRCPGDRTKPLEAWGEGGGRTPITTGGFIGFTKCLLRLCLILTLPETDIAAENSWLEDEVSFFWSGTCFRELVCFGGGGRYMRESNGRPYQETDPGCFCCNPEGFFSGDGLDWGNLTLKKNAFSST